MPEERVHVILGDGAAGMTAAQTLRAEDADGRIVVISDDPQPFYYRAALTNYLHGAMLEQELWALPPGQWEDLGIERLSDRAIGVDLDRSALTLRDSGRVRFDTLLIATGARARRLATREKDPKRGVPGACLPGITSLRTFRDATHLVEQTGKARQAVVIGGGILGIEAAEGLEARGLDVTLVHRSPALLERMVDRVAGELVRMRLDRAGIRVITGAETLGFEGSRRGVKKVRLSTGDVLAADIVVQCIGAVPNTGWLDGSAVGLERGYLPVDRQMQVKGTRNIWAAGDVIAFRDASLPFQNPGGLWQPAVRQGRVAAMNMAQPDMRTMLEYRPGAIYNATRAAGLDIATLGLHVDGDGESIEREDRRAGIPIRKRALLRDGHLVGVMLVGDRREGTALQRLMNLRGSATDVSKIKDRLFDPGFDLFRWVAAQEQAPGVRRWNVTLNPIAAPVPQAAVEGTALLGKRSMARPIEGLTARFKSEPAPPITLTAYGKSETFDQAEVRVGPDANDHLRLNGARPQDRLTISREGMVWIARRSKQLPGTALHNGRALRDLAFLSHGDTLQLGPIQIQVRLRAKEARPSVPEQAPESDVAVLVIDGKVSRLSRRITTLGASDDNEIVINQEGIARHHAQIHRTGSPHRWYVVPASGDVLVNDKPANGSQRLFDGADIRLGPLTIGFELERARPAPVQAGRVEQTVVFKPKDVAYLVGTDGPLSGRALAVPMGASLGRAIDADVRIDDPLLSRHHARFEGSSGEARITDLGSQNGIKVGRTRITANEATRLEEGASVRIGRTTWTFTWKEPDPGAIQGEPAPAIGADDATVRIQNLGSRLEEPQGEREDHRPNIHPMTEDVLTLGRGHDNGIVINKKDVSRTHVRFVRRGARYEIFDAGSTYGTKVNDVALEDSAGRILDDKDVISLGKRMLTYRIGAGLPEPRTLRQLVPLDEGYAANIPPALLAGQGPWQIGRSSAECAVRLPFPSISRKHASIRRDSDRFLLKNLSAAGTAVNNKGVPQDAIVEIEDGDRIALQDVTFRFECEPKTGMGAIRRTVKPMDARQFEVDEGGDRNPLEADLDRMVRDELDACIGCHECMRACPLPDAKQVTIASLNAYANRTSALDKIVRDFVSDCTQCHACVPVCPADIRRSRIVLFNKLRAEINEKRRLSLQVGEKQSRSTLTVGDAADLLQRHAVFSKLPRATLLRIVDSARLRQIARGDTLYTEGSYLDALWVLLEGSLNIGVRTGRRRMTNSIRLSPGQTTGEVALLGEQPTDHTVTAGKNALVLGLAKYAIESARRQHSGFDKALGGLYLGRSLDGALARLHIKGEARQAVRRAARAERYRVGRVVMDGESAAHAIGIVSRGFLKEVRRDGDSSRVANYLKPGDLFGGPDAGASWNALLHYEAATALEVFTLRKDAILRIGKGHPDVPRRLLPLEASDTILHADDDGWFDAAGGAGLLQATQLLLIDTRMCTDCDNCVDACTRRHGRPRLDRQNAGMQQGPYQVPASCYHCTDPVCLLCSVNGIVREPTGEIRIIDDNCIGCGVCAERCPYDNIFMYELESKPRPLLERILPKPFKRLFHIGDDGHVVLDDTERLAVKCDLCEGFKNGPACVRSCPTGAAFRADPKTTFGMGRGD